MFFVVVFMLILPDVDIMLFFTFITSCETSSIKIWFVLAAVLAENLTQVVFRQPFVIQSTISSLRNMKFLVFYIFSSPYIQLVIFDVIVFPLAAFVSCRDLNRKNAWLNHTIESVEWSQWWISIAAGCFPVSSMPRIDIFLLGLPK